jgi:hypothetical protein
MKKHRLPRKLKKKRKKMYRAISIMTLDILIEKSITHNVIMKGAISGIDTSQFKSGQELYVDPNTPGGLTNVKQEG